MHEKWVYPLIMIWASLQAAACLCTFCNHCAAVYWSCLTSFEKDGNVVKLIWCCEFIRACAILNYFFKIICISLLHLLKLSLLLSTFAKFIYLFCCQLKILVTTRIGLAYNSWKKFMITLSNSVYNYCWKESIWLVYIYKFICVSGLICKFLCLFLFIFK